MFATTTVRFALVAAVLSSLTTAAPIFNLGRKEAVAMVRRAENDGQLAQGTNYFFTTLHLEDACAPGQVACVSGNYATCSGEGNWEITPCTSGSTCLATPASSPSGISIQCTSQETAQSSIQNAGGNPNSIAADFHVTDAPFVADTVADPSASSSASATATATESSSAPADTASPTETPTETASATESSASSTCTPDDEDDEGTIADGPTDSASSSTPTETASPTETCTEEEPVETETITVIVVPVPSQSGVYSTTTLFPEVPSATVVGTEVPVPTDSSTEVPSATESSSESAPTESSSQDSSYTESSSSSESAPTDSSSEAATPTESSSSSASAATVTTIVLDPGYSIPALPTGAGDATAPVVIPVISVVGTHEVPAAKRMARVIRRV